MRKKWLGFSVVLKMRKLLNKIDSKFHTGEKFVFLDRTGEENVFLQNPMMNSSRKSNSNAEKVAKVFCSVKNEKVIGQNGNLVFTPERNFDF